MLSLFVLSLHRTAFAQEWTWVKGANTINAIGVYGTQGTPATSNLPGSREGSATWTDLSGNLWLFGGNGFSSLLYGRLNDLWKLNPTTHQWTWVNGPNNTNQSGLYGTLGTPSSTNNPGARSYPVTWTDDTGNLWMFGGLGYDAFGSNDNLNDLWKYSVGTNQWTWMGGSNLSDQIGIYGTQGVPSATNIPGARRLSNGWKDNSGNLWLFGGYGFDASSGQSALSDLWKFDPSANTWTWVKGASARDDYGIYGTQGVPTSGNYPGSRYGATSWKDNSGNLWLFAGYGKDAVNNSTYLSDVWKYTVSTNQWAWVKGSNVGNAVSVNGTQTIPASANHPGGRYQCTNWADNSGNLVLQGGFGITNNAGGPHNLNEVWKFNVTTNQWSWIRGVYNEIAGAYGTQSVTALSSDPGSGYFRVSWKDASGKFWLFGGYGFDVNANHNVLSELWVMDPCPAGAPINVGAWSTLNICNGNNTTLFAVSGTNTVSWYANATTTTALATGTNYTTPNLSTGSYTYFAAATNTCGASFVRSPLIVISNNVNPTVTTGPSQFTVNYVIGSGQTINSNWSPWNFTFTDPLPLGAIITGVDLTCDGVDQGWGGTGYNADFQLAGTRIGYASYQHYIQTFNIRSTKPFPNYIYGGTNVFQMYFAGWGGWQGFIYNATLHIRYQTKTPAAITACQNSSLTLKAYGAVTYTWSGGVTDNVSFPLTTSQTYTVTGANIFGCVNTATQQVNVISAPTLALSGNTSVCLGNPIAEAVTISGASTSFSWNTGSTSLTISATPSISTTYSAIAQNSITGCSHSVIRKLIVSASPVLSVSASSSIICSGRSTTLSASQLIASYGLNFDGLDDYVETNANITELAQGDFCIEAWVKTTGYSLGIVNCANSNTTWEPGEKSLYLDASGIPTFVGWGNNYIPGNIVINDGTWHHVAVVWNYGAGAVNVGKMYVDGVDHTGSVSYTPNQTNLGTFKIGLANYWVAEAPNNFTGTIDDVRIWNVARTSTAIAADMNSCLLGNEPGLCAYYKFEDGPGNSSSADLSYNDYHGVLTNMNTAAAWVNGMTNCTASYSGFSWLPGGITTSTISVSPAVSAVYTLNVSNNFACSSAITKPITVNPTPTVTVGNGTICIGSSFTLVPSGASSYSYSSASAVVNPTISSSYSVAGTSLLGCVSNGPGISNITVNSLPVLSISGPSAACNGSSITQTISGASVYLWSTGSTNSVVTITPTVGATYSALGTNTITGCINTVSKLIVVGNLPVISVNSGNICAGSSFTMLPSGAATYSYSSGTNVVSPLVNTSYYVTGTSALGCVSTGSAISNVIVNAAPVIVVNSGAICAGKSYTIVPGGAATYTISGGSYVVSPLSNTNYSVTGTNVLGCISSVPGVASISVNPLPLIVASNGSVCSASSFTINPSGALTYTYSSGSNTVAPLANSNYSVTGTSSLGCVSSNTAVITVSVLAQPLVSINGGTVCSGSIFVLSPTGALTYTYSGGTVNVSPLATTNYSVTGTNALGCVSSNTAVATVTVISSPIISVANGSVCPGNVFTLSPSGAITYTYSSGSQTVSPLVNSSYAITGSNSFGCMSSNTAVAAVVVGSNPILTIAGNTTLCIGQTANLIAGGASTYTWNTNANGPFLNVSPATTSNFSVIATAANGCNAQSVILITVNSLPTISVNSGSVCPYSSFAIIASGAISYTFSGGTNMVSPAVTSTYSVYGTNANGCVSALAAVSTVSVKNNVTIAVSGTSLVCSGSAASLSVSGANSYSWSTGSFTTTTVVTPSISTTYSVIGATGTCADTSYFMVTVNPLPSLTITTSDNLLCVGKSATITSSGASSYTWHDGSNTAVIVVSPLRTTNYTLTGMDSHGCTNTLAITQSVSTCAHVDYLWEELTSLITILPNPNNGDFVIKTSKGVNIKISNSLGQIVSELELLEGENQFHLNEYNNGIYFVSFYANKQFKTLKIIKQ